MSRQQRHDARVPIALAVLGWLAVAFFVVPILALVIRVPWSSLSDVM